MREPTCLPVEVRPVPGFPGLSVSAAGEVYGPRGRRKSSPDREGYLGLSVRRPGHALPRRLRVHVAVLLAWIGPRPEGMEGRHLNGNLTDNRAANLEWATHRVNIGDKVAHGTMHRPGRAGVPRTVLTEADVAEMRRLWPAVSIRALGERFGVGKTTAGDVVRGKSWRHLTREEA
jgi:hypothetical protein